MNLIFNQEFEIPIGKSIKIMCFWQGICEDILMAHLGLEQNRIVQ